jgi:hypothetical protein
VDLGSPGNCRRRAPSSPHVQNVERETYLISREPMQPHPHSGATYRLIAREDGAFEVEVTLPDTAPITMTDFAKHADAQRWIDQHQATANAGRPLRHPWLRPSPSPLV